MFGVCFTGTVPELSVQPMRTATLYTAQLLVTIFKSKSCALLWWHLRNYKPQRPICVSLRYLHVRNSPLPLRLDPLSPPLPVSSSCEVGEHFKMPLIFRRLSAT